MILLKTLFDRDNILLPEWLLDEYLEDDWLESQYSFNGEYHTWILETEFKGKVRICFNGKEYHFQGFHEEYEAWIPFVLITEDTKIEY